MSTQEPKFNPFDHIPEVHALYCRLTGQSIILERFDRQRQWYEILRAGFTIQDVERVVKYLEREIAHGKRNPGALKLSNLLQPDWFEEDLNLNRVPLHGPRVQPLPSGKPEQAVPVSEEEGRKYGAALREFRLRLINHGPTEQPPTEERDSMSKSPQ